LDTKQYEKKRTLARNRLKAQQVGGGGRLRHPLESTEESSFKDYLSCTGDGSNNTISSLHRLSPIEPITEGDEQPIPFSASASTLSGLEGSSSPLIRWGDDIADKEDDDEDGGYMLPPLEGAALWNSVDMRGGGNAVDSDCQVIDRDVSFIQRGSAEIMECGKLDSRSDEKVKKSIWGDRTMTVPDRRRIASISNAEASGYKGACGSIRGGSTAERPIGSNNLASAAQSFSYRSGATPQSSIGQHVPPQQQDQLSDLLQMLLLKQQQQVGLGNSVSTKPLQLPMASVQLKKEEPGPRGRADQYLLLQQQMLGQQLRAKAQQQQATVEQQAATQELKQPFASMSNSDYLKLLKLPEFWMLGDPRMLAKIRGILLAKRASTAAAEERRRNEKEEVEQLGKLLRLRSAQELSDLLLDGERLIEQETLAAGSSSHTLNSQQRWTGGSDEGVADDVFDASDLDFDDARFEDVSQVIRQDLGYDLVTENDIDDNK